MFMENRNVNMDEGNASENYLRKPILRLIKCEVEIMGDREHTAIGHKHITVPLLTKIKTEIDEDRNPLAGISNIPPVTFDLVIKKETESEQPNRGDKQPVHQTKIRVKEEFVGDNTADEDLGSSPQESEVSQKRQNSMDPLRIPDEESPLHDHSSVIEAAQSGFHPYHFNEIFPDQRKLVVLLKKLDPKVLHNHQRVPVATVNANNSVLSSQSKKKDPVMDSFISSLDDSVLKYPKTERRIKTPRKSLGRRRVNSKRRKNFNQQHKKEIVSNQDEQYHPQSHHIAQTAYRARRRFNSHQHPARDLMIYNNQPGENKRSKKASSLKTLHLDSQSEKASLLKTLHLDPQRERVSSLKTLHLDSQSERVSSLETLHLDPPSENMGRQTGETKQPASFPSNLCLQSSSLLKTDPSTKNDDRSDCSRNFSEKCIEKHDSIKHVKLAHDNDRSHPFDPPAHELSMRTDTCDRYFICDYCQYKSRFKGNLKKHIYRIHILGDLSFSCGHCDKVFCSKEYLAGHIARNHSQDRRLSRDICTRKFKNKGSLRSRVSLIHRHDWPFHCSICTCKFKSNYDLCSHILHVHMEPIALALVDIVLNKLRRKQL